MVQYRGSSRKHEVKASRRRKDTRLAGQKISEFFSSPDGGAIFLLIVVALSVAFSIIKPIPFAGEFALLILWMFWRMYGNVGARAFYERLGFSALDGPPGACFYAMVLTPEG